MNKPISLLSSIKVHLRHSKQLCLALFHDMYRGEITLRATGLVYTTLLSLVPLLALGFSVLKGFGVHNQLEPLLLEFLAPLGEKATELSTQVLGFVDNVKVGVLGVAGLAILLYTVVSLLRQIEEAFNYVWHVKESRPLLHQFRDYLSVVLIGPILLFSLLGFWSSVQQTSLMHQILELEYLAEFFQKAGDLIPTVLLTSTFLLMYILIPNTKVKWWAALGGALFAAIMWQIAGKIYASFVVSAGPQTAIYSIFASIFLLVLWMYLGWLIILVGTRLAYYIQYPEAIDNTIEPIDPSPQLREAIALAVLLLITKRFIQGESPLTLSELSHELKTSELLLMGVLDELEDYEVLRRDHINPSHYLLMRDPEHITLHQIRQAVWYGTPAQQSQLAEVFPQLGIKHEWCGTKVNDTSLNLKQLAQ